MLDLAQLLRVPSVDSETGFDLSPDGEKIAYAWNPSGQWEIYEITPRPGAVPKQLTSGPGGKFAPRYSPDGTTIAYMADLDGSENYHLYLYDRSKDHHRDLIPHINWTLQPYVDWSPDSRRLAIISNRQGCFDTYIYDLGGSAEQLIMSNGCPAIEVRWSPAGDWLAIQAETSGQDNGIFLASLTDGKIIPISDQGRMLNAHDPCWSPDGNQLAFCSDRDEFYNIGVYQIDTGQIIWLTTGVGDRTRPSWSPDGRRIVVVFSQGADTSLSMLDLDGGSISYRVGNGLHSRPTFTPDGNSLVCVFDSPSQPPDLWLLSLNRQEKYACTRSLLDDLSHELFVMPEEIYYPGLDGILVPALLYCPDWVTSLAPAVVNIHGGPNWLYQFSWFPLMSHLASRGWIVLAPNYRGSTGYGQGWQNANRFDIGGVDTADVVAGAKHLIHQGLVDPERIAVTGRSHGGYLTMMCLTGYPDLWAGGSAVVPFLNWFTGHQGSRSDLQHWDIENMGSPEVNHDLWFERSPYFFLDRLRVPVQLICGAHDPRCPASESSAARDKLLSLGKEVDFHLYPDEGHVFLKTDNLIDAEQKRVDFLARLLS